MRMAMNSSCNTAGFSGFQVIVSGFLSSLVSVFGVLLNLLNIMVFAHRVKRRINLNLYLLFLSTFDLIALTAALAMISAPVFLELTNDPVGQRRINRLILIAYPIAMIAQTASVYLTVCVSTHRLIEVVFPMQKAKFCDRTTVKFIIFVVILLATTFNVPRFWELEVEECLDSDKTLVVPTNFRLNSTYIKFYCVWAYTILMLILPFLLLVTFNFRLVKEIRRTERHRLDMEYPENMLYSTVKPIDHASYRNTSIMLIGISLSFLICNSMALTSNVLEMLEITVVYSEIVSVSNLLVAISMSINTFIYYAFSSKFRLVLKLQWQCLHLHCLYCCCSIELLSDE